MLELNGMTEIELREFTENIGSKPYRGTQLFNYFNKQRKLNIHEANILPADLRNRLQDNGKVTQVKIHEVFESSIDETKKLLFKLEDNNIVEGVVMKYKHGYSQCISTQVGCRMGCSFCASTKGGLIRNLTTAEMLNQVYEVEKYFGIKISNIILMGSGEPLDNYDEVIKFLRILHDEKGKNMSFRNMTISTCGLVDKIYKLAEEKLPITLAISLHNINDKNRSEIMPINKKFDLKELLKACKYYSETLKTRITFEYTIIDGFNDRIEDINNLEKNLKNMNCHINLIPLNPIGEFNKKRPSYINVKKFEDALNKAGLNTTIRRELGSDISASCGQLRRKHLDEKEVIK